MSIKIPVAGGDLAISPYGIQIIDTNPLPRPAAGDVTYGQEYGQDIDGGRATWLTVTLDTIDPASTEYKVVVEGVGSLRMSLLAGVSQRALQLPDITATTLRPVALRAMSPTRTGLYYEIDDFEQEPEIPVDPEGPIVNLTVPAFTFDTLNGMNVGASLNFQQGTWDGSITPPGTMKVFRTNDDKATSTEIAGYVWGSGVPNYIGYKLFLREGQYGPLNPSGVFADSALSAVITSGSVTEIPLQPTFGHWFVECRFEPTTQATTWTGIVCVNNTLLNAGANPYNVQWTGVQVGNYPTDAALEPHWRPTVYLGTTADGSGNMISRWRFSDFSGTDYIRQPTASLPRVRFRWQKVVSGPYSAYPTDAKEATRDMVPEPPPPSTEGWAQMSFRSEAEASAGLKGGDQGQCWHGSSRSKSDPSLIVAIQDTGGTWYSDDDGKTWAKSPDVGLRGYGGQGVLVDPEDPNRWYSVGEALFEDSPNETSPFSGIHMSTDKGRHWTLQYSSPTAHHQRVPATIVYDPNTSGSTMVLYATITRWDGSCLIMRSSNRGVGWTVQATIPASATAPAVRGRVTEIQHHPSQSGVLFLCTQRGLYKSTNSGVGWTRMNGVGGLPVGDVLHIEIRPSNGNEMYTCVGQSPSQTAGTAASLGIWHTTDGGADWNEITAPAAVTRESKIFVGFATGGGWAPVATRDLYLVPRGEQMAVSHNGGATWTVSSVTPQPGRNEGWDKQISDATVGGDRPEMTTRVMPHPFIQGRAWIHTKSHNFQTDNAGNACRYSGEGFSGEICTVATTSIAFSNDPLRMAFGMTDSGYRITENGGVWFHVARIAGYTEGDVVLKHSSHSIAIHPNDPNKVVAAEGFRAGTSPMRLFKSEDHFPGDYIGQAGNLGEEHNSSPWIRVRDAQDKYAFLHWNKHTPSTIYSNAARSVNEGNSWIGYAAGMGVVRAVFPEDNDVVYGTAPNPASSGLAPPYTLKRSSDRGATIDKTFPDITWGGMFPGDFYYQIIAIHPTDPAIFFTISSTGDLARFDGNTGVNTWRNTYGLTAKHSVAYPGGGAPKVSSIAIDPQNVNVGYVGINSYGNNGVWMSENIQAAPASVVWKDITQNFQRVNVNPKVWVHPLTGDVMAGTGGIGGLRWLPPPSARSHPSLAKNFPIPQ